MSELRQEPIVVHADHRGRLLKVWPHAVTGEVYAVELRPGHPRAHHIHQHGGEWFVALRGTPLLVTEHPDVPDSRRVTRLSGARVYVPCGLAHALFADDEDALVLVIAEVNHPDEITVPHPLAPPTDAERRAAR